MKSKKSILGWMITGVGIAGTASYLYLLNWLVNNRWQELRKPQLELNQLGDFLAGAFGPLAIWWLVLGYFQQGIELRQNSEALRLQADELKRSVAEQNRMANISSTQLEIVIAGLRSNLAIHFQPLDLQETVGHHWTATLTVRNTGHDCSDLVLMWQFDIIKKDEISWPFLRRFEEQSCVVKCPVDQVFDGTANLLYTDGTGERIELEIPMRKGHSGISIGNATIKKPAEAGS